MIEVHAVVMDLLAGTQVAGAGGVAFQNGFTGPDLG
jgi:hypothetical protein